jgi:hypothetical protein
MDIDTQREEAKFLRNARRWRVRRRLAISSFAQLVTLTFFYIISPFFMVPEQATTFSEFNSIIVTLIGFHSTIVMLYVGAATYSDNVNNGVLERQVTVDTSQDK